MRYSLWRWFRRLFSKYSKKTVHLYRIFLFKIDVYLLNRKKNKCFKQIGKTLYLELLQNKEIEQIIETIQPILSLIDKIDKKIDKIHSNIFKIAEKENISKTDVEKIDQFIKDTDKKMKEPIYDDFHNFIDDELEDEDIDINYDIEDDFSDENNIKNNLIKNNIKNKKKKNKKDKE